MGGPGSWDYRPDRRSLHGDSSPWWRQLESLAQKLPIGKGWGMGYYARWSCWRPISLNPSSDNMLSVQGNTALTYGSMIQERSTDAWGATKNFYAKICSDVSHIRDFTLIASITATAYQSSSRRVIDSKSDVSYGNAVTTEIALSWRGHVQNIYEHCPEIHSPKYTTILTCYTSDAAKTWACEAAVIDLNFQPRSYSHTNQTSSNIGGLQTSEQQTKTMAVKVARLSHYTTMSNRIDWWKATSTLVIKVRHKPTKTYISRNLLNWQYKQLFSECFNIQLEVSAGKQGR